MLLREYAPRQYHDYGGLEMQRGRIHALARQASRLLSDPAPGAARQQLARLLSLCAHTGALRAHAAVELDDVIRHATQEPPVDQPAEPTAFSETSRRRHIQLILEDL